jgi:hypothetical protein
MRIKWVSTCKALGVCMACNKHSLSLNSSQSPASSCMGVWSTLPRALPHFYYRYFMFPRAQCSDSLWQAFELFAALLRFWVLKFELRTLQLARQALYHLSHTPALLICFWDTFVQTGLRLRSSYLLPSSWDYSHVPPCPALFTALLCYCSVNDSMSDHHDVQWRTVWGTDS